MYSRKISLDSGSVIELLESASSGIPVIALHGIGSASTSFSDCAQHLGPGIRFLAWNAPGYGASTSFSHANPVVADYADALLGLIEALQIERFHLVGHSLGGLIGLNFCARFPERVLSAVLGSVPLGDLQADAATRWKNLCSREHDLLVLGPAGLAAKRSANVAGTGAGPEALERVRAVMARVDPRGYAQASWMLAHGDACADAMSVPASIPCHFLVGESDAITPPAVVKRISEHVKHSTYQEIPGQGHAFYVADPTLLTTAIARSVAS